MSVAFNWRGAVAKASASSLLSCGLTKLDLKLLHVCVIEKRVEIYMFSRRSTLRHWRPMTVIPHISSNYD